MDRRGFLTALGVAVTLPVAGCTGGGRGGTPTPDYDIGMASSAFQPTAFEITAGTTVTWYNGNSRAHTVTAYEQSLPDGAAYFASGGFDSEQAARDAYANGLKGSLVTGDYYSHTFEVPGTYGYFCIPHERAGMVGEIVVTE